MSWSVYVLPLPVVLQDAGGRSWLAGADRSHREVPEPEPGRPLPSGRDVVETIRRTGCHGYPRFRLADGDPETWLPACPDPASCGPDGLDLGELSLSAVGDPEGRRMALDSAVDSLCFRKPNLDAAFRFLCALASGVGPLMAYDDCTEGVLIRKGDDVAVLRSWWPG